MRRTEPDTYGDCAGAAFMALLVALILSALLLLTDLLGPAHGSYRATIPPPQYDRPFRGQVVVHRRHHYGALVACSKRGLRSSDGCAWVERGVCNIVVSTDHPADVQASVVRHEIGHCNGWPASHPGAR